jgi:copper chaperone CopZ
MTERLELTIDGMGCGHCVASVRAALEALPGVAVEGVEVGSAKVRLTGTEDGGGERVRDAIRSAGFEPRD